ncbi:hypothetical protein FB451DRAFT_1447024 [Mycena latifolia]|nr:hypothetical protein FB451DRAFT_1447024 [Mycena latifolia]
MALLNPDVLWEIAVASDTNTLCTILQLCSWANDRIRGLLYKHISVGDDAGRLIHTLAYKSSLPPLVQSLIFRSSLCAYIEDAEWAVVLRAMINLRRLVITHHVPLDSHVLPDITFRLHVFISVCTVFGAWADFLALQPELEEIGLHSDLLGFVPGRSKLPMLRSVKGRPEDVARFALNHHLDDIWLWLGPTRGRPTLRPADLARFAKSSSRLLTLRVMAPQLQLLMDSAPCLLETLLHLTLDEDLGWCHFNSKSVILGAVRRLRDRTPILKSLMLTCSPAVERWLPRISVADGANFCASIVALSLPTTLRTFHFCGMDGCVTWRNWGQNDELVSYAQLGVHGPWDLDPVYAKLVPEYA